MMKTYTVLDIKHITRETFILRTERPKILIKAGQCFNIGLPGMNINREYSIYSDANAEYLDFLIRAVDKGLLSKRLQNLQYGDQIELDGPYGEFCLNQDNLNSHYVFIGSGTGIAPFHSFIKTFPKIDYKIIHGIRFSVEKYGSDDYSPDRYTTCISKNDSGQSIRIDEYLKNNPININSLVYLCGNRNMIIESVQILLDQGFNGNQLKSEVFF